ncbi:MAG: phosphate ABC transporter permease PstA [Pirellulales bacterium]
MSSDRNGRRRPRSGHAGLAAHGEPWIWLTGTSLVLSVVMIVGLLGFIAVRGAATFWPVPLEQIRLADGRTLLGEMTDREQAEPATAVAVGHPARRLVRTGQAEETGSQYEWIDEPLISETSRPEWATVVERLEAGRLHAVPRRLLHGDETVAEGPAEAWRAFEREHPTARARHRRGLHIDKHARGDLQRRLRAARLAVVQAHLDHGGGSPEVTAAEMRERALAEEIGRRERTLDEETSELRRANEAWRLEFETASGRLVAVPVHAIVRAWQPNRLSALGSLGVYASRWGEFLADDPREANSAGGVFPAIWGTVTMTLIMALFVAPFGVLAALYLREYAGRGPITAFVRVAINNLAGVPSIVYGAFGLGFFCYGVGAGIDELFFKASLVADGQPTFGTGGLLWASLTLALLTLPVVIVATEEALSAVPNSMREGSYACGAGKWQTIRRIVLPRALPGIMTGLILAMARGAGEVAPLMLVGVKKLALELPVDGSFPFVHPEREFMHLAYLIYDVGFQSPDSQAARPMVFTITFLLVAIIALLNVAAIWMRSRLRRRYVAQQF